MKRRYGSIIMAIAILSLGFVLEAHATTIKEYATTINLAGRQRMLTQKMTKEMLLIAKGYETDSNKAALKQTVALFDNTLNGLISGNKEMGLPPTTDKNTLRTLGKVKALWRNYKAVVDSVLAGGEVPVRDVATLNMPLLKTSNSTVKLYEESANREVNMTAGIIINLAGKQRMLTQKMSKEILLVALDYKAAANKTNLMMTATLFDKTLKGLKDGDADLGLPPTSENAIRAQLDVVAGLWADMKPITEEVYDADSTYVLDETIKNIATMNLPLLKNMNKAVKMYEKAQ